MGIRDRYGADRRVRQPEESPKFYSIELLRDGERTQLGTAPSFAMIDAWFSGAHAQGLLPNPPQYTDEIQIWEVGEESRVLRWVWRVTWMMFEAKQKEERLESKLIV